MSGTIPTYRPDVYSREAILDPYPHYDRRRKILASRLTPKALRSMRDEVGERADAVVAAAVETEHVDGVGDIAEALPTSFVPDLIGGPARPSTRAGRSTGRPSARHPRRSA